MSSNFLESMTVNNLQYAYFPGCVAQGACRELYLSTAALTEALERIGGIISELTIPSLPKFLWWKASPDGEYGLFKRLASQCDTIIVDSSTFREPVASFVTPNVGIEPPPTA